jgi:hypothetical protein
MPGVLIPVAGGAVGVVLGAGATEVVVMETVLPAGAERALRDCSARGRYVWTLLRSDNLYTVLASNAVDEES